MTDLSLLDRVRVARAVGGTLTFQGDALEELRQLILAGNETRLGYMALRDEVSDLRAGQAARAAALADTIARTERAARLSRSWITGACLTALIVLAASAGGLLS
ncbi:hypothetical protein [Amaricoccus solimangrovi]|uniref:Uncharacterized protein n=1 Tax=Amaricoccus solimangrovi TaxID=2589815 RepID=A0A501W9M4_9RHOB|nr:hypothetical protein [Amaricoccus solimangrovi]TPE45080.1 hypothetical protein FJM51_22795 [Amaricoccus solimangrovi]